MKRELKILSNKYVPIRVVEKCMLLKYSKSTIQKLHHFKQYKTNVCCLFICTHFYMVFANTNEHTSSVLWYLHQTIFYPLSTFGML